MRWPDPTTDEPTDETEVRARLPELGDGARSRAAARARVNTFGWIRAVKWLLVVLLVARLFQLFVSWLLSALV